MISKEKIEKIAEYMMDGLTEEEACILSSIKQEKLQEAKDNDPELVEFFEKQQIKFKHKHLREVSVKANDKNSQWLLEKRFPEEFGSSRSRNNQQNVNILSVIINKIQESSSGAQLIPETRESIRDAEIKEEHEYSIKEALK